MFSPDYPTRTSRPRVPAGARQSAAPARPAPASFSPVRARVRGYSPLLARGPAHLTPAAPLAPVVSLAVADEGQPSPRPSFEFEPNRADFKVKLLTCSILAMISVDYERDPAF